MLTPQMPKKKVLLHICCGVCACASIPRLKESGYAVAGFFYNPNIYPAEEYSKRKEAAEKITAYYRIPLIGSAYETAEWKNACAGFETEKEGGARCRICFALRLEKTYQTAKAEKFDYFTTTLSISPYKNSRAIFETGEKTGRERFLEINFKKKDGFKKSLLLAKKLNIYRQNYCGCIYSLRDRGKRIEDS